MYPNNYKSNRTPYSFNSLNKKVANSFATVNKVFQTGKIAILLMFAMTVLVAATMFLPFTAFAQTNSSSGGNMATPIEQMQDAEFSQVVLSSTQVDEIDNVVKSALKAAEQEGNMTEVIIQLKVLQNQIDLIKQEATVFGP